LSNEADKTQAPSGFVNIGYGNMVAAEKIVAIVNPDAAPIKRLVAENRTTGRIVDATQGRKTRAVIFTADYIILSSFQPETIAGRAAF